VPPARPGTQRVRGPLPPVPPAGSAGPRPGGLATVTRLRRADQRLGTTTTVTVVERQPGTELARREDVMDPMVRNLARLGVPERVLGADFAEDALNRGLYAALTSAIAARVPQPAVVPTAPGDVLLVVGPGAETLLAARAVATSLRLDPESVLWAAPGELANFAPAEARVSGVDAAHETRWAAAAAGEVTVVAVHAPLRGGSWVTAMVTAWKPAAVWAVADATRKPADVAGWLDALPQVDALVLQDSDLSADPAAVLGLDIPVAVLDGVRATPHRWASLLCERSEAHGG
jgi:hypothetical protein